MQECVSKYSIIFFLRRRECSEPTRCPATTYEHIMNIMKYHVGEYHQHILQHVCDILIFFTYSSYILFFLRRREFWVLFFTHSLHILFSLHRRECSVPPLLPSTTSSSCLPTATCLSLTWRSLRTDGWCTMLRTWKVKIDDYAIFLFCRKDS